MARHGLPHSALEDSPPRHALSWAERDRLLAIRMHRALADLPVTRLLIHASTLGNGTLWYVIIGLLALGKDFDTIQCAVRMLLLGLVDLTLYFVLKRSIGRPRPYVHCADIRACVPALDRFSFPSGHTLHAVAFSLMLSHYFPAWALPLWIFTGLVMVSRVALGLHYPSDVLAAFAMGMFTGGLMLTTT